MSQATIAELEVQSSQCVCGHFDTSHDCQMEYTGSIPGCMEPGCDCYSFTPAEFAQEEGYCEGLLKFIDEEIGFDNHQEECFEAPWCLRTPNVVSA